jgi:hypothetical protein
MAETCIMKRTLLLMFIGFLTTNILLAQQIKSRTTYIRNNGSKAKWKLYGVQYYNHSGEVFLTISYADNLEIDKVNICEYDSLRRCVSITTYNNKGMQVEKIDKKFDSEGVAIPIRDNEDIERDCKQKNCRCRYEKYGNIIQFTKYSSNHHRVLEAYKYNYTYW